MYFIVTIILIIIGIIISYISIMQKINLEWFYDILYILNIPIESVLKNPLYFGQKDLALTRKGYEYDLLNKIIGDNIGM